MPYQYSGGKLAYCSLRDVPFACIPLFWFILSFIVIHPWDSLSCALAARGAESRRWTEAADPRICQTFAASPAEPGELPCWFSA